MTNTPAGWFDDGHGALRWWDGAAWTEHTQPVDPQPVEYASPAGYPGAAPGVVPTAAYAGAYPPPPPGAAKGSLGWVLPVVLGGIALVVLILGVVFVPMIVAGVTAGAQTPEERAAVAAVELFDDAWQEQDCDKYLEASTENLEATFDFVDCDEFVAEAEEWAAPFENYVVRVVSVETVGDEITVLTDESYTLLYDEDGNELPGGEDHVDEYRYVVIEEDDAWRIDVYE